MESGERFDITFLEEENENYYPIILHCSPTGSIERVICSLWKKQAGWKCNVAFALAAGADAPLLGANMDYALELARELKDGNIR